MPSPFGTDKLQELADGKFTLICVYPKGWVARSAKTFVSAEHPGTTVRWEEAFYEVLSVARRQDGRVEYTLGFWDEQHMFRVVEDYSPAAEEIRAQKRRDARRAEEKRQLYMLMSPLVGHLPSGVQLRMESETGVSATFLTLVSAIPLWLFGFYSAVWLTIRGFAGPAAGGPPGSVLLLGLYLLLESTPRIVVAYAQGRPAGSLAGTILWSLYELVNPRAALPRAKPADLTSEDEVRRHAAFDSYRLREAFFGLLPAEDQARLSERFGFDALKWGRRSAVFLLVPSILYFVKSCTDSPRPEGAEALVMLPAAWLLVEQVFRLWKIQKGTPAGSILGFLVRPSARRLLA